MRPYLFAKVLQFLNLNSPLADAITQVYAKHFPGCGWTDQWASVEPVKQHGGLQDAFGNWHQPPADRMAKFAREMYSVGRP